MADIRLSAFKSLRIIHKAMLFGQLIFAAISFYLSWSKTVPPSLDQATEQLFQVIALVFSAAGFFGGTFLMKKKIQAAREGNGTAQEKFNLYRSASIVQWAMLEGPALFCIVIFLISANYALLVLAGALLICFAMLDPSRKKLLFQLNITEAEAEEL